MRLHYVYALHRHGLSAEFRFVIGCSLPPVLSAKVPLPVSGALDWGEVLGLVKRHRVAPMVSRRLSAGIGLLPPPAELRELQERARLASIRALRFAAATMELARVFQARGVDVLPLRGPLLSQRLFGDPGMREVRDIDLLVRSSCLQRADALLRQHGFDRRVPRCEPTPRMLAALLEMDHHFEYYRLDGDIHVELHWRLASWDPANLDWLWRHSRCCGGPGAPLRELDRQALTLLVADHGAGHKWFCLKWLADAAALLAATPEAEAAPLVETALELDLARPLAQAALLVERLYGLDLPASLAGLVRREPLAPYLAGEALDTLLGPEKDHFSGQAGWKWFRSQRYARRLRSRSRPLPPARFFLRPRDFDQAPLPNALFWLYYPLRPLLWLRRVVRGSADSAFERTYFSGAALYGDDFDESRLREWWKREERAYFHMAQAGGNHTYGHRTFNDFHVYRFLAGRFPVCLAFGCARGDDVAPLAARVGRFVAIEPAEAWWSERINGVPAEYRKPSVSGDIPMESATADLAVCFSALHHVANASHVLSELVRVLRPGGLLLVREPICTMGDWRKPRRGLTASERGFPPGWLDARAAALGLRTLRKAYCGFPLTTRLARWFRLGPAFNNSFLVRLDAWMSRRTRWNLHYHRDSFFKKIAPIEVVYTFEKAQAAGTP